MNENQKLVEELRNINALIEMTKTFQHGVKSNDDWVIFTPTNFIYSYFIFNSIFSIDWEQSFKN